MGRFRGALVYLALSAGGLAFRAFKGYFSRGAISALATMSHNLAPWKTWPPVKMQLTEASKAATRNFNVLGMIPHAISFICLQAQYCNALHFIFQKLMKGCFNPFITTI